MLAIAGLATGVVALFVAMLLPFGSAAVTCFGVPAASYQQQAPQGGTQDAHRVGRYLG